MLCLYRIYDTVKVAIPFLRNYDGISRCRHACPERDITTLSAHDLHDTASPMRNRRISYPVDSLHGCIRRCVKSQRILRTCHISVYCSRDTDSIDTLILKCYGSAECSIPADGNKCIYIVISQILCRLLAVFFLKESLASAGEKYRSTLIVYVPDVSQTKRLCLPVDKSLVTTHHTDNLYSTVDG